MDRHRGVTLGPARIRAGASCREGQEEKKEQKPENPMAGERTFFRHENVRSSGIHE